MRTCSIDDCESQRRTRGWCNKHYLRWRTHGDVTVLPTTLPEVRILDKFFVDDGCWGWMAGTDSHGYGVFRVDSERGVMGAHRFVYEWLVGPIPQGLELDHLCFNRACVNPAHLEPVTHHENTRRRDLADGR